MVDAVGAAAAARRETVYGGWFGGESTVSPFACHSVARTLLSSSIKLTELRIDGARLMKRRKDVAQINGCLAAAIKTGAA